jgi:glutathione S-transferase
MVTIYNKKVATTLKELITSYSIIHMSLENAKSPGFVLVNPNGRLPAIECYHKEVECVISVLDVALEGRKWFLLQRRALS